MLESRRMLDSGVVFNEIMYHPTGDGASLEWVELHNQLAIDVDVSDWSIRGGIDYVFPEGTFVPGGGYLVVAASPEALAAAGGPADALGPFAGRLANEGERLELVNNSDRLMNVVEYGDAAPWPVAPDGSGTSLAKLDRGHGQRAGRKLGLQRPRRRHARPREFPRRLRAGRTGHPRGDRRDLGLRPVGL